MIDRKSYNLKVIAIILGMVALSCWIFFWIFFLSDSYLTHPEHNMLVRLIVVAAIIVNIAGIILEIIQLRKKRNLLHSAIGLFLHIIPLIAFGAFFYWLAFGHWM